MELRQLRYFIAIAEEKGFHKAARRLHVAQPALSACVKQLEDEIGHRLLERSKHRVSLIIYTIRQLLKTIYAVCTEN